MNRPRSTERPFAISIQAVVEAFRKLKANHGGPGVDGCTIEDFEADLRNTLYVTWNRMSSGSYFPPPVKAVEMAKPARRAPEPHHHAPPSPRGSPKRWWTESPRKWWNPSSMPARMATGRAGRRWTRWGRAGERCFKFPWVMDCDIAGFFTSVPHNLIVKASRRTPT